MTEQLSSITPEKTRPQWYVLAVLSLLMGFASISTDLYLPAMPQMASSLHVSQGVIAFTISGYLVGFSLMQLLWGPVSDRFGRRIPISVGLFLFIIGSTGCAFASSASMLIGCRFIQAIGACASVALSRAMVRDLYEGDKAAQMMSTLMTVMAIAPLLGPLVGGEISVYAGWRYIFGALVVIGILAFIALWTIEETLPSERRSQGSVGHAIACYWTLLRQPKLLAFIGVGAFFYGATFAYIAGTPFAYVSYYGVPEQLYGFLFAAGIVGIMLSNMLNIRLVNRLGTRSILFIGTLIAFLMASISAIDSWCGAGGLWGVAVPLFLMVSTAGFIVANAMAGALQDYPKQAGAVSAMVGASQYGVGVIGSGLVGILFDGTPFPMGLVIAIGMLCACLCGALVVMLHKKG